MRVYIDTSNKDLFVSLVSENETKKYILIKDLVKKADALPGAFMDIMGDIKVKEIKSFYITIGPGSFTGSRTALVFARSICQITGADLFVTSSIQLIAGPEGSHDIFVDARSNKSYYGNVQNGKLIGDIKIVEYQKNSKQSYDKIIANPSLYDVMFIKSENILAINPLYIKDAQIGGK